MASCISSSEALQTLVFLSDLYPEAKLSKDFIAPIFERVVQVHPGYTVEKAIVLDKDLLAMARNFCLSTAGKLVVENAEGTIVCR